MAPTNQTRYLKGRTNGGRSLYEANDSNNTMIGSDDHDQLNGKKGNDLLKASKSHDFLLGGLGHDTLYGGHGDDLLVGGKGQDKLIGGPGSDTFFISYGQRTIVDFDFNERDSLLFGVFLTNISYAQSGDNVLVQSDQGITSILNQSVEDFIAYGHP